MRSLKYTLLFLLLTAFESRLFCQHTLSGIIRSQDGAPQADVIVQLLKASDSALVKFEFSDGEGRYQFSSLQPGSYLLQTSTAGSRPQVFGPVAVQGETVFDLRLQGDPLVMDEVEVRARKPLIERSGGVVSLHVENSINAEGSSAYDVLEKAPGVRVDNNENISLNGRPGTAIWIDHKPTPMTGADLANYLRGIPSSAIQKIEFISNPSAKYDAAGSSIINIVMKKEKRSGTNGSVSLSYGQGVYPKSNNSLSLNHRNKKVNIYGSYSYARRLLFSRLLLRREFSVQDSLIGAFDQDNYFKYDISTHMVRAGVDYYINSKNTLGFMVNGVSALFDPTGTNVSDVYDDNNLRSSMFRTSSRNFNDRSNISANLNYRHEFDTLGTSLVSDFDYARYNSASEQNIETRYLDFDNNEIRRPYLLYGDLSGSLDIYALKNDFSKNLRGGYKLEAGQKSSFVKADNDLSFFDRSLGSDLFDSSKSNHFIYTENINAAFVSMARQVQKWDLRLGLRVEHTFVTGEQLMYDSRFERNYAQLFPNLFAGYRVNEKNTYEFSYSRRIRRPGYDQLNPFKFYLDPSTYREGNPYLQPSITESFELSHIFKRQISTTIGFGRTYNNIIEVIAPLTNEQRVTVQTNRNLAQVDVFTLNGSVPYEIKKWWFTSNNFNIYYARYSGNIANTPLKNRGNITMSFNSVNTFNISQSLSAELSGNYQAPEVYAYDVIGPIWSVNLGVQKKILKGNGVLRLNVSDVFFTNKIRANVRFNDYNETFLVIRDTRVATISFSYKFGKNGGPGGGRRQGGAEDIKQRAGSGGA